MPVCVLIVFGFIQTSVKYDEHGVGYAYMCLGVFKCASMCLAYDSTSLNRYGIITFKVLIYDQMCLCPKAAEMITIVMTCY